MNSLYADLTDSTSGALIRSPHLDLIKTTSKSRQYIFGISRYWHEDLKFPLRAKYSCPSFPETESSRPPFCLQRTLANRRKPLLLEVHVSPSCSVNYTEVCDYETYSRLRLIVDARLIVREKRGRYPENREDVGSARMS
jgi:hypothetical protein